MNSNFLFSFAFLLFYFFILFILVVVAGYIEASIMHSGHLF